MHHGLIAATATQPQLLAELERHAGEFVLGQEAMPPYEVGVTAGDDGWVTAIGERDGRAFLLDSSMLLSDASDRGGPSHRGPGREGALRGARLV